MSQGHVRDDGYVWMLVVLLLLVVSCGRAWAQDKDEFDGIKCGADIAKSLVRKRTPNERIAVLEERHRDLGLKGQGGTDISDRLFLVGWRICGHEYEILVSRGIIRDALLFPAHSAASPMFIGSCQVDGKKTSGTIVAVLNNSAGYDARDKKMAETMLKATAAWKIDESKEKFVQQSIETLTCPLDGVVTSDGGP